MSVKDFFQNVITLGAHGRIQNEVKTFDSIVEELHDLNTKMETRKTEVNTTLLQVVEAKKKAVNSLNEIQRITKNLKGKQREIFQAQVKEEKVKLDFDHIEKTLTVTNSILNAGKGAGAGIASATATTWLIGNFAAASTGTAISTLSGVAATNATLAWLGGGSIAAGGGGMAAGTVVLGGIIAIPVLAVMGLFNHLSANKEIKQIKEKELEVLQMIDTIRKNIFTFDIIEKRANEIGLALEKATEVFSTELNKVFKKIYPFPLFSIFIKNIRKLFKLNYYTKKDIIEIAYIGNIATNLAILIDTKIIEN